MKTSKEFDYDLWAIEENGGKRYFCRIKATGEECEISLECMRVLVCEDTKIKRYYKRMAKYGSVLSLDITPDTDNENEESSWLIDRTDVVEEVIFNMLEEDLLKTLTDKQREVYLNVMKNGISLRKYSLEHGLNYDSTKEIRAAVRKKFRKIFE